MRYWVYGLDNLSKQPREPLFLEAESLEAARAQATELGMQVEDIEPVEPRAAQAMPPSPPARAPIRSDHPIASVLVTVFRVLAGISALVALILVFASTEAASKVGGSGAVAALGAILQGVVVVSVLLAVAEGLRLGIAIERNTRSRRPDGTLDEGKRPEN
jgi:hypothetical protein